jgi:hypothetical protein
MVMHDAIGFSGSDSDPPKGSIWIGVCVCEETRKKGLKRIETRNDREGEEGWFGHFKRCVCF